MTNLKGFYVLDIYYHLPKTYILHIKFAQSIILN